jgi:hypothetical protein
MQSLKFDIRHPDGRVEELKIEGDRALIGSGAHCEIRLPVDQAAIEHVFIQASPAGVFAEARSFQPAPTINGGQFTRTQIVPGSVLAIGYVQIGVTLVDTIGQAAQTAAKENKVSPMTLLMAAVIAPLGLYVIYKGGDDGGTAPPPQAVPELWAEPITSCSEQGGDQALSIAEDKFDLAVAKHERRPFSVQDGVAAVPLYEEAAACFTQANQSAAAKVAGDRAASLRIDVAEDFRTHRVRLEYAISREKWDTAQREVRVLLNFVEGHQHEYVNWLSALERKLKLKYGTTKKK